MAKTMFLTVNIVASHLFFVFLLVSVSVSFDHFRNVHPMLKEDSSSSSDSDEWDEDDLGKVTYYCCMMLLLAHYWYSEKVSVHLRLVVCVILIESSTSKAYFAALICQQ